MRRLLFRGTQVKIFPFKIKRDVSKTELKIYPFHYEIRHSDECWSEPVTIEERVWVNHWGMLISKAPLLGHEKLLTLTKKEAKCFIS